MSHLVELADKTALTWELDQMDFRGPFKAKSSVTSEFYVLFKHWQIYQCCATESSLMAT